jgi:hypothetical protein
MSGWRNVIDLALPQEARDFRAGEPRTGLAEYGTHSPKRGRVQGLNRHHGTSVNGLTAAEFHAQWPEHRHAGRHHR